MVCNGQSTTVEDTCNEFIGQISRLEKTFVAKVNNGKLALDLDVFYQVFNLPMISRELDVNADSLSSNSFNLSENNPQRNSSERKSIDEISAQNSQQLVRASQFPGRPPNVVVLRSLVRYGHISDRKGDLQIWDPEFQVPECIHNTALQRLHNVPLIGVIAIKHSDGGVKWYIDSSLKEFSLDGEIQLDADEQLIMKTRVCNGEVSFEEGAVQFKYGNVCIPQHIIDGFRSLDKKPNGDLYIILHKSGNFRSVVKRLSILKKVARSIKELF